MLAAIASVGLAAGDSSLVQISVNGLDRLAIQLAETVNTVAGANGQSTEEFAELIPHREKPPWSKRPPGELIVDTTKLPSLFSWRTEAHLTPFCHP